MFHSKHFASAVFSTKHFPIKSYVGGADKVREKKEPTTLTDEQAEGLIAFGEAQMGIKPEPEVIEPIEVAEVQEIIESPDTDDTTFAELFPDLKPEPTLQEKIRDEEDIALILAIVTAHNSY